MLFRSGGTLAARERAARAGYDQAAAQYRASVIAAFQNVADALYALQFDAEALKAQAAAEQAALRIADVVQQFADQLASQQAAGKRYLVGDRLSALDIYWATFLGLIEPLPEALCPMATFFRPLYTNHHPVIRAALSARLIAHREFIYREFLELPVVF